METKLISNPDEYFWQEFDTLSEANFEHNVQLQSIWLKPYIKFLLKGSVYIVAVYKQTRLVGCLPLEMNYTRATRYWDYRVLSIIGGGSLDFFEVLTENDHREEILKNIFVFLQKQKKWDYVKLSLLPDDQVLEKVVHHVFEHHYEKRFFQNSGCFFENTTGDWNGNYESLFNSKNKDLKKSERRLENDNIHCHLKIYTNDILYYFRKYVTLYAQRRESLNQLNKYENENYWNFLKKVLQNYENNDLVEFSVLYNDLQYPLAIQLDFIYKNTRYHWNHAYNEDYSRYSPGKLLLKMLLQKSFANPEIKQNNHMRGLSSYKKKLTSHKKYFYNIDITNKSSIRIFVTRGISRIFKLFR